MDRNPQLDVKALFAALDQRRKTLEISWRKVAEGAGVSPSTLTRIRQGKRPDVDGFAALVAWLGVPPDRFLRPGPAHDQESKADVMTVISTHLRAQRDLTPESAQALEDILRAAYNRLRDQKAGA